jgi:hypothetical protein
VSTTEELLDRKVAAPVYKTENTAVGISHADHVAPFIPKKLAITSPTSGGRSIDIVRSRTQTMEFFLLLLKFCRPLLALTCFFSFSILCTVGRILGSRISPLKGNYVHLGQHKHRTNSHKHLYTSSGIRTEDLSIGASEDSSYLRLHGNMICYGSLNNLINVLKY